MHIPASWHNILMNISYVDVDARATRYNDEQYAHTINVRR